MQQKNIPVLRSLARQMLWVKLTTVALAWNFRLLVKILFLSKPVILQILINKKLYAFVYDVEMSMRKAFVEQLSTNGGTLDIESALGLGTMVTVIFQPERVIRV